MIQNFSLLPINLTLGALDLTENLVSWHDQTPHAELNTPQSTTGDFVIIPKPFQDPDDFNDFIHPEIWAKGQRVFTLSIDGYLYFTGYILNYFFDPDTNTGQGTFGDQIALQRSLQVTKDIEISVASGTPTTTVVSQLLTMSGNRAGVQIFSDVAVSELTGSQSVPISTRDPIGDAQNYLKADRRWVYVTKSGGIRDIQYPESTNHPLFVRARSQFQAERDRVVAAYPVQKMVVTGARDFAKVLPAEQVIPETNRVVRQTVGELGSAIPAWGDIVANISVGADTFLNFVQGVTERNTNDTLAGGVTRSEREALAGAIFGENLAPTTPISVLTLLVTSRIVTNDPATGKITTQTARGLATPSLCYADNFIGSGSSSGPIDPDAEEETSTKYFDFNKAIQLVSEVDSIIEGNDYQPPIDTETASAPFQADKEPLRGEFNLSPSGYLVYLQAEDVRDVGYLHDASQAYLMAKFLADLEIGKSKALLVVMPIPREYLVDRKPFVICHLHNIEAVIDAPELYIEANGGQGNCRLVFTANVRGRITPIAEPSITPLYIPSALFAVIPIASQVFHKDLLITPIQFSAENGIGAITWSVVGLPSGLSLSAGGLLSDTPSTAQSATSYTITATDSTADTASFVLGITVASIAIPDPGYSVNLDSIAITYNSAVSDFYLVPSYGFNAITYNLVTQVTTIAIFRGITYSVFELESYNYFGGFYTLDKINDGIITDGVLRDSGAGTLDTFKFYISFSSTTLTAIRFHLGQFNGGFNKPNQIAMYNGVDDTGTLLDTIVSTTYGLNTYDPSGWGTAVSDVCFVCTLFDSVFDQCGILELLIFDT